jgi:EPS-associated MarR family transcriptional regulator
MACKPHQTENTHFKVLRLLESNPQMNQRELAQALGVSLGKANYCLKALLDKGMLKVQNFQSSKRKLAYAYLLTPAGIAEKAALAGRFLQRKMDEFEQLKAEIESLQQEAIGKVQPAQGIESVFASSDRPASTRSYQIR